MDSFFNARFLWNTGRYRSPQKCPNFPKIVVFGHRKPTQWTHSDEIWRISVLPPLLPSSLSFPPSWPNFGTWKIHFASKPCVLVYCQRYCTALQLQASAKLCGVVQRMELRKFRRGRHLYSAGQPSVWHRPHSSFQTSSNTLSYFLFIYLPKFTFVTSYWLWSPYGIGQTIIYSSCGVFFFFFFLSSFFPRLISAVADWMSAILPHIVWP